MTEQKPFRVETVINAPLDSVWQALTSPELIREWFGWDYDGLDAEIRNIFVDNARPLPPDRIELEGGQVIELDSDGRRTIVRVVMPGSLNDADWDDIYDAVEEGWRSFFEQLRFLLERRPDGQRRTIFLTGTASAEDVLGAVERGGEPTWHESRYQRMTVDGDGHLLGVAAQHPLDSEAAGPVSVTVTTYGLDDATFTALREQWETRWRGVAKDAEVTVDPR